MEAGASEGGVTKPELGNQRKRPEISLAIEKRHFRPN